MDRFCISTGISTTRFFATLRPLKDGFLLHLCVFSDKIRQQLIFKNPAGMDFNKLLPVHLPSPPTITTPATAKPPTKPAVAQPVKRKAKPKRKRACGKQVANAFPALDEGSEDIAEAVGDSPVGR